MYQVNGWPHPAAALAVVAGFAGLEGVDLAAVDLVDDARLVKNEKLKKGNAGV